MTSYRFSKWRPRRRQSTSGFPFGDVSHLRSSKTIRVPNFVQIPPSSSGHQRHIDFQDGGRQPCWICFRVVIDYSGSVIDGVNFVDKFRLDRIYTLGDTCRAILAFCCFG